MNWLTGKDADAGKDWRQEEKATTEDEMVGWHRRLGGHEFEQAPGVGVLQSMGSQGVGHDWATELNLHLPRWCSGKESAYQCRRHKRYGFDLCIGRSPAVGNGNPPRYSCLENFMDNGAWWATAHGATESRTWLSKWAQNTHTWSNISQKASC